MPRFEQVAQALNNRGLKWGQKGETEKALADYTRLIDQIPAAPVEPVAKALNSRGLIWARKGDTEKELADYTRLIEQLPGASVEQVARALRNRGVAWGEKGDTEKALADYTCLIEQLSGAPVEQVAHDEIIVCFTLNRQSIYGASAAALFTQVRVKNQITGPCQLPEPRRAAPEGGLARPYVPRGRPNARGNP